VKVMRVSLIIGLLALCGLGTNGQDYNSLRGATPQELVSNLNKVVPDPSNAECVTWAINRLANQRYEPAVSALTRLLDFRRPPIGREKEGLYLHAQGLWEIYPAVNALALIGEAVLPTMLDVIKNDSRSATKRENAVFVWMQVYRNDAPLGVALLKRESDRADEAAVKQRLNWAISQALNWCNPSDEIQCRTAAKAGLPE
jgi:hypothetical protein